MECANIIGDLEDYSKLCNLMHGYESDKINVLDIYNNLFCKDSNRFNIGDYSIAVEDILSLDVENIKILKNGKYPLLNHILYHTLCYLFLRLKVEKVLI